MKKFLACLSLAFVLVLPVFAQDYGLNATAGAAQLTGGPTDPTVIIGKIIGAGLSLIGIVFFILTLYAGITWMVARGNEENAKKAINTIVAAAIGMIITMSAYAITSFILNAANQSALGGGGGGGNGTDQCSAIGGTCMSVDGCVGNTTPDLCPGDSSVQCCTPFDAGDTGFACQCFNLDTAALFGSCNSDSIGVTDEASCEQFCQDINTDNLSGDSCS